MHSYGLARSYVRVSGHRGLGTHHGAGCMSVLCGGAWVLSSAADASAFVLPFTFVFVSFFAFPRLWFYSYEMTKCCLDHHLMHVIHHPALNPL